MQLADFISGLPNPPRSPAWEDGGRVARRIQIHTRGLKPVELIEIQRPNEPQEIKDYRIAIFEPFTQDPILRAYDSFIRAVLNSNYKIEYPETTEEYFQETRFEPIRGGQSFGFLDYMVRIVGKKVIEEPNGLLVWLPVNPDGGLPSETDPTKQVYIEPLIIPTSRVISVSLESVIFEYQKIILYKGEQTKEVWSYLFITEQEIIQILPYAWTDEGIRYRQEEFYTVNGFDEIPAFVLGGEEVENEDGEPYYQSFYEGFVGPANAAIKARTDSDGIMVRMGSPIMDEKADPCPVCKGHGEIRDSEGKSSTCTQCNGAKLITSKSPYSSYQRRPPKPGESEAYANSPAVIFIHPPVEAIELSIKTWRQFLEDAEKAVNILYIDEAQSGVAKKIDREQKIDQLTKMAMNLFSLIKRSADSIESYLIIDPSKWERTKVVAPTEFNISTTGELQAKVSELKKMNAPAPIVGAAIKELTQKLHENDPVENYIIEILLQYDPLFTVDASVLNTYKATGAVTSTDIARHIKAYSVLRQMAEKEGFYEMTFEEIKAELDKITGEVSEPIF